VIDRLIDQLIDISIDQSISQSVSQSVNQSINKFIYRLIYLLKSLDFIINKFFMTLLRTSFDLPSVQLLQKKTFKQMPNLKRRYSL